MRVSSETEPVDFEVQGIALSHHSPAVSRSDQRHGMKPPEQQAQRVTLVVVRVPDLDILFAAHSQ